MNTSNTGKLEEVLEARPLSFKLITRVFSNLGGYKWLLLAANVLCLICAVSDMYIIREVRILIDRDDLLTAGILTLVGPLAFYCLINRISGKAQWLLTFYATNKAMERLRKSFFEKLQSLSKSFYDTHKSGWLIARNTGDMFQVGMFLTTSLMMFIFIMTMVGTAIIQMADISLLLLAPSAVLIPLIMVLNRIYKVKMSTAQRYMRQQNSRLVANLAENIKGIRVVQAFSREEHNLAEFNKLNKINHDMEVRVSHLNAMYLPSLDFIGILNISLVIGFAALIIRGHLPWLGTITLSTGDVVGYIMYMNIILWPIRMLVEVYTMAISAMAAAERIFEIMDTEPSIKSPLKPAPVKAFIPDIKYHAVSFRYSAENPWVIQNLTLEVPVSSTVALIGQTGAGKTTLTHLAARFYDVNAGVIEVSGRNIKQFDLEELHSHMGIVLQEGFLFSGSILDNIRFRRPDMPREKVIQAAMDLGTHDAIINLESGYDTLVLNGGSNISEGQRQIISLTRALAADPKILILDEPTSSLDVYTEKVIQKALTRLVASRTTLIVAHRLSTIQNADIIAVIGQGHILEKGSHDDLIKNNGPYTDYVSQYNRKYPKNPHP